MNFGDRQFDFIRPSFTRISNGLKVVTVPMPGRESVSVAIWVRAGSRYETKGISGVSHFLEHMLFKGTKRRSTRQIKQEIEGVGGILNAFTSEECTCYFAKLLKGHLSRALDVLADMVNHATLDAAEFKKEKPVILEEIKMYCDLPAQYVHELMGELLWPDQPLGRPIAGTLETAGGINRSEMEAYRNRFYHPRNLVVSVAGDINHREVVRQCEEHFQITRKKPAARYAAPSIRQRKPETCFVEKPTEQTHFVIGLRGYSRVHPDRYKLALMNVLLGANMSSRLFDEVREKRGLAYEIKSGLNFFEDAGSLSISAGVETKKAATAVRIILRELEKLRLKKIGEGELRRAKEYFMSQLAMTLEDTLEHLLWICEAAVYRDQLPDRETVKRQIERVTAEDLQHLAQDLFKNRNLNLSLLGPVEASLQKKIQGQFEIHES